MTHQSTNRLRGHDLRWVGIIASIAVALFVACVAPPVAHGRVSTTLSINSGAFYTTSATVTLVSSSTTATQMRVCNAGGVYTAWQPYATTKTWVLSAGDGLKTVYVQYKVTAKTITRYASITLDTAAPVLTGLASSTHPDDAVWYSAAAVTVSWDAATDPSGVAGYSWVLDADPATQPDAIIDGGGLTASFAGVGDGVRYVHVRAIDKAGNCSATLTRTVRVDTVAPVTTDNTDGLTHVDFLLVLSPSDTASGVAMTEYRIDEGAWTTGAAVDVRLRHRHRSWNGLPSGAHTIEYRSHDQAGNVETTKSCRVILGI